MFRYGGIAQLVEQLTFNQWVQGSSPCASTIENLDDRMVVFLIPFCQMGVATTNQRFVSLRGAMRRGNPVLYMCLAFCQTAFLFTGLPRGN